MAMLPIFYYLRLTEGPPLCNSAVLLFVTKTLQQKMVQSLTRRKGSYHEKKSFVLLL
jgi:hypothetical protein